MLVFARLTYLEFKALIPDNFKLKRAPNYTDFRVSVGREAARFREKYLPATKRVEDRHKRWQKWISGITFNDNWDKIKYIDDDIVNDLGQGKRDGEYATALYYRFHSFLEDESFARDIDNAVFGSSLKETGNIIFEKYVNIESANQIAATGSNPWRLQRTENTALRLIGDAIYDDIIEVEAIHVDCRKALGNKLYFHIFVDSSSTFGDVLNTIWLRMYKYLNVPAFSYGKVWTVLHQGRSIESEISFSKNDERLLGEIGISKGDVLEVELL